MEPELKEVDYYFGVRGAEDTSSSVSFSLMLLHRGWSSPQAELRAFIPASHSARKTGFG